MRSSGSPSFRPHPHSLSLRWSKLFDEGYGQKEAARLWRAAYQMVRLKALPIKAGIQCRGTLGKAEGHPNGHLERYVDRI